MNDSLPAPTPTPLRVLHFPQNDAGHPGGLSAAERSIGLDSRLVTLGPHPFGYPADRVLELGHGGRLGRARRRARALAELARDVDVFHFNGGQSFLPGSLPFTFDIPLLRRMGKRVFVTYLGSDARPASAGRDPSLADRGVASRWAERVKRVRASQVARRADGAFCVNPDLLDAVPGAEFVPYASVDPSALKPSPPASRGGPLRIVHAPSRRDVKGTRHVLAVVDTLRRDLDIELDLVEGVPHAEALRRYRRADVAIDQLEIGWYGVFAVECMALAKPVVARLADEDVARIPAAMAEELPVQSATGADLADRLRRLVGRDLAEIGARGRAFVEHWHDPVTIARRTERLYRGTAPSFWSPLDT